VNDGRIEDNQKGETKDNRDRIAVRGSNEKKMIKNINKRYTIK
jgi:hypothetical protein